MSRTIRSASVAAVQLLAKAVPLGSVTIRAVRDLKLLKIVVVLRR
jgi:hypothetical protein